LPSFLYNFVRLYIVDDEHVLTSPFGPQKKKDGKGVVALPVAAATVPANANATNNSQTMPSPWLQVDHLTLPDLLWAPVLVNSGGLLNRAYHASSSVSALDSRIFVFGGIYTSAPDEIATDVITIETSSIFGVQVSLCEGASHHKCEYTHLTLTLTLTHRLLCVRVCVCKATSQEEKLACRALSQLASQVTLRDRS